jgi:hypothetical protein
VGLAGLALYGLLQSLLGGDSQPSGQASSTTAAR